MHKRIVEHVRAGMPFARAAVMCGAKKDTAEEWLSRGRGTHKRRKTKIYAQFAQDVDAAAAERVRALVDVVRTAAGLPADLDAPLEPGEAVAQRRIFAKRDPETGDLIPGEMIIIEDIAKWAAYLLERYAPDDFARPTGTERYEQTTRITPAGDEQEAADAKHERHIIEISTALTRATFAFSEEELEHAADADTLADIQRAADSVEDAGDVADGEARDA